MAKIKYKNSEGEWKEAGGKTSLSWNDITDKPDLTGIPSRTEVLNQLSFKVDKVDGKQLSTEDFTTILKNKLDGLSNYDDTTISEAVEKLRTDFDTLVSGDTATAIESFNEIIAFLNGIEDSESLDSIIASIEQQIAGKMDKVTLAAVATSGSYNDLSDKPTIPSAVTESTVSGWGFTKNTGTYSKPSAGIPKTDLDSAVQTSLGKADTALQSYTEQYKGTVTGVKMNGTTKSPSSGVVDLGTVVTAHQDISGKQDKLVSGTNIKTINGESILGTGNLVIEGGSGSSSGGGAYPEVYMSAGGEYSIEPNTFYIWGEVDYLDLSFDGAIDGYTNEYLFQFETGNTDELDIQITLPDSVKWANDTPIALSSYKIYQVSVLNGLAAVLEFSNEIVFPVIVEGSNGYEDVYDYFVNTYELSNISSDSPTNRIYISENLWLSGSYEGQVQGVHLYNDMLLLWTQKAIDGYRVPYINASGECGIYEWD